jgi:hypothetical protein
MNRYEFFALSAISILVVFLCLKIDSIKIPHKILPRTTRNWVAASHPYNKWPKVILSSRHHASRRRLSWVNPPPFVNLPLPEPVEKEPQKETLANVDLRLRPRVIVMPRSIQYSVAAPIYYTTENEDLEESGDSGSETTPRN